MPQKEGWIPILAVHTNEFVLTAIGANKHNQDILNDAEDNTGHKVFISNSPYIDKNPITPILSKLKVDIVDYKKQILVDELFIKYGNDLLGIKCCENGVDEDNNKVVFETIIDHKGDFTLVYESKIKGVKEQC